MPSIVRILFILSGSGLTGTPETTVWRPSAAAAAGAGAVVREDGRACLRAALFACVCPGRLRPHTDFAGSSLSLSSTSHSSASASPSSSSPVSSSSLSAMELAAFAAAARLGRAGAGASFRASSPAARFTRFDAGASTPVSSPARLCVNRRCDVGVYR
eukprot:1461857-Prymnesium_polylepis.1